MKYCNKCGFKLGVDAKFCSKCGNKIELNDYDADITGISESLNLAATISEDERKKQESTKHMDSKYKGLDRKSNYERLMLDPDKKSNSSTMSTIRYLIGIFLVIIGVIQTSIVIFLAGISLFPIIYEFVDSHLRIQDYGKMILKVIAVLLPVLLLVTLIPGKKPAEVHIMNSKDRKSTRLNSSH